MTAPTAEKIGRNIRRARAAVKLTQGEMARRMGVTPTCLHLIETGKRAPMALTLWQVARVAGCSVDQLLGGIPEPLVEDWKEPDDVPLERRSC